MGRMCAGVALPWSSLPTHFLAQASVRRRRYRRAEGCPECRFLLSDRERLLPVLVEGELRLLPWGSRRGDRSWLPCTAWAWMDSIEKGMWAHLCPEPAVVPASYALDRGVWFHVTEGLKAIVVQGREDNPVAYLIVEPASHYYRVMTRSRWMPSLVNQTI